MDGMDEGLVRFFQRLMFAQGIVFIIREEAMAGGGMVDM